MFKQKIKKDSIAKQPKQDLLFRLDNYENNLDEDIESHDELQLNPKIKNQLKDIDAKIEVLGKVCDNQYKNSYNMLKNILDKENQKVDNDIKSYISNLRNQLVQFKEKLNFDYKGKYKEVTKELNMKVEELNKNKSIKNKLEKKI